MSNQWGNTLNLNQCKSVTKIHLISVNIDPLNFFIGALSTDI